MSHSSKESNLQPGWGAAISALAMVFVLTLVATPTAQAQTYKVLYNFTGGMDGSTPTAGLTKDAAGNLYGTAEFGGPAGQGTVFKLSHKGSGWVFTPLYSFHGGSDGAQPAARVIVGPDGSLYGTTIAGGDSGCFDNYGCGTVFNLRPQPRACAAALCPWTKTVLYRFTGGSDGANPDDLIFDQAGNLYGSAGDGGLAGCNGYGCGVVYELSPSGGGWTESVLYSFTGGNDGGNPDGAVTFDQAGSLYGTTANGGLGLGTVYKLTPSGSTWLEDVIYNFDTGAAGQAPVGPPVFDASGDLYFATANNDVDHKGGAVYELSESHSIWTLKMLWWGVEYVSGGVTLDTAANVYDTSVGDGVNTWGTVFEDMQNNQQIVLHRFTGCSEGCQPYGGVVFDVNGNLYGTASRGGVYGYGVVWEITP